MTLCTALTFGQVPSTMSYPALLYRSMMSGGTPCARIRSVAGAPGGALSSSALTPRWRSISVVCLLWMSGPSVQVGPALPSESSSARSTARFTPMQNPAVCATIIFMELR
ncbi:hypothetical protein R80B4_01261 [Fibrobacteres bacterium R8-0-B4]